MRDSSPSPTHAAIGDPYQILSWVRPTDSLEHQLDALLKIVHWLCQPISSQYTPAQCWAIRLRYLNQLLERNPELKNALALTLQRWILEVSWIPLLAQTALQQESALLSEFSNRFLRQWLPRSKTDWDWSDLVNLAFPHAAHAQLLRSPSEHAPALSTWIREWAFGASPQAAVQAEASLRATLFDALTVLASEIASVGVSSEIREKLLVRQVPDLPFVRLNRALSPLIMIAEGSSPAQSGPALVAVQEAIAECRQAIVELQQKLQTSGVSVSLVFKLEKLETLVDRVDALVALGWIEPSENRDHKMDLLLADLIDETRRNRSLAGLLRQNFRLLARKIAERTGSHGEHYIARTGRDRLALFWSASGGGALTAFTAFFKVVIANLKLPPFMEGIASTLNYSGSFLLMQSLHLTLATKQPSMTAASLASRLGEIRKHRHLDEITNEIIAITRSQVLAAVGNVLFVIPAAWLLDRASVILTGEHVLRASYAVHFLESIHPLISLTIPYAALTGVLLWLASVWGGWAENAVVYHRIHEVIAERRQLIHWIGAKRMAKLSKNFPSTIAAWTVNFTLGVMLAFVPILGRFSGLPLDVRHVTLTSGTATLAICVMGVENVSTNQWLMSAAGVILIGALNFGVSFLLALQVAASARGFEYAVIGGSSRWSTLRILLRVFGKLARQPWMLIRDERRT